MSESVTEIPTDFYTDQGFLKSISITSHPRPERHCRDRRQDIHRAENGVGFRRRGYPALGPDQRE